MFFISNLFLNHFHLNLYFHIGESYAGHYIPEITYLLFNNPIFNMSILNFKGIGIGDGLIDANIQLINYHTYGFIAGILSIA